MSDPKGLGALTAEQLLDNFADANIREKQHGFSGDWDEYVKFRSELLRRLAPPPAQPCESSSFHYTEEVMPPARKVLSVPPMQGQSPATATAASGRTSSEAPPAQDVKARCPKCNDAVIFGLLSYDVKGIVANCVNGHRFPLYSGLADCAQFFHRPLVSQDVKEEARKLLRRFADSPQVCLFCNVIHSAGCPKEDALIDSMVAFHAHMIRGGNEQLQSAKDEIEGLRATIARLREDLYRQGEIIREKTREFAVALERRKS